MAMDGTRLRKTLISVKAIWRLGWLILCLVLAGCATLVNPPNQPTAAEYDLSGRIRIQTENSILRLDFYLIYCDRSTELQFWGPFGLGRKKLMLSSEQYLIEDTPGNWRELQPYELPNDLPQSVWRLGPELGKWLLLRPGNRRTPTPPKAWSWKGIEVQVDRTQTVENETVCKRLSINAGEVDILVLCDRWRRFH